VRGIACLVVIVGWVGMHHPAPAQVVRADAVAGEDAADDGVSLLGDRARERQLDQARRLFAEGRWSDAAVVCDEILAAPGDAFLRRPHAATFHSLKAEAAKLLRDQPPAGRRAYELLHGARAERLLDEGIAADDHGTILEVARRWFETSAGREAAVIAAYVALEEGQVAEAASWLDRLGTTGGDDMRGDGLRAAVAALNQRAKRAAAADGEGRRLGLSDDWRQHRGDATRNAVVAASRPLLAPRYRVPLVRDPEESRQLWQVHRDAAGRGHVLRPVGTPLVVGNRIVVQTGWGLLAVDFTSGKRLWLGAADPSGSVMSERWFLETGDGRGRGRGLEAVFDDATAAGLTAAAGLVVAVEPAVATPPRADGAGPFMLPPDRGVGAGNSLAAYELSGRGGRRWKLPQQGGVVWYLGPPLAVGDSLFALVEEQGSVRVDCIDARTGAVAWSQPLADLEESHAVTAAENRARRLAGFTPAQGDGMLVCPIGAGTVIAIDLATRSLSWAHRYRTTGGVEDPAAARRRGALGDAGGEPLRLRDAAPVIAGGRVLLTPADSDQLICLDLREGTPAWPQAVDGGLEIAAVVDDRVVITGPRAVEARRLDDGQRLWRTSWSDIGGQPSGRGLVTPEHMLLPLDSAEVVQVRVADGRVAARSASRGGLVPGNLVACRGEIVSRGVDSLDVFFQVAALERRIEAAAREPGVGGSGVRDPGMVGAVDAAWVGHWRGELDLESGDVAKGLTGLLAAAQADGWRPPPNALGDAVIAALRRDFAAAAPFRDAVLAGLADDGGHGPSADHESPGRDRRRRVTRAWVAGFLSQGDLEQAWDGLSALLGNVATSPDGLVADGRDRNLAVSEGRWVRGRLAELHRRCSEGLRGRIDAAAMAAVAAAAAEDDAVERARRLERLGDVLDGLPAGVAARARFAAESQRLDGLPPQLALEWTLRRDAAASVSAGGLGQVSAGGLARVGAGERQPVRGPEWPLGRVVHRRGTADAGLRDLPGGLRGRDRRDVLDDVGSDRMIVLPVTMDPATRLRDLGLVFDARHSRLLVRDGAGRPILDPVSLEHGPAAMGIDVRGVGSPPLIEASTWGSLLFVRYVGTVTAIHLAGGDDPIRWSRSSRAGAGREGPLGWLPSGAGHGGGRAAALGRAPLGMIVTEADDASRAGFVRGGGARAAGVLHHDGGTLSLIDPVTGRSLWERHGLVRFTEVVADDAFVCVLAPDGQESLLLSMDDGRLVSRCSVPPRRERLGASGRRLVVVRPVVAAPDRPVAAEVALGIFDPVSGETAALAVVPGESRGVLQDDRLYVLEPDGAFTAFDLGASGRTGVRFRTVLTEPPEVVQRLAVIPCLDRIFVVAGVEEAAGPPRGGLRMPLHQSFFDRDMGPPVSGGIWALDRDDGESLWTAPAMIDGYRLPAAQPVGLPVLLLCRHVPPPQQADGRPRLGLLLLDKRTGHAVLEERGLRARADDGLCCDLSGDPGAGIVTVRQLGADGWRITLEYTGDPAPPRPPYRAGASPTEPLDGVLRYFDRPR